MRRNWTIGITAVAFIFGGAVMVGVSVWSEKRKDEGKIRKTCSSPTEIRTAAFVFSVGRHRPKMLSLEVRNLGKMAVRPVWVWNIDAPNFLDAKSILASVCSPGMKPAAVVERLWRFVYENSYHWWPATLSSELHDPATFFAAYGYGICDDRATVFATLASLAGVPARTAGFGAWVPGRPRKIEHVVAEAYYDGRWHMYDADGGVVFRKGGRVLSLREARDALRRGLTKPEPRPWPADYVEALKRAQGLGRDKPPVAASKRTVFQGRRLWFSLRAGEEVCFDFEARKRCHMLVPLPPYHEGPRKPPRYANGRIIHTPRFDDADSFVAAEGVARDRRRVALAKGRKQGWIIYRLQFPFPLVDGRCRVRLQGKDGKAIVEITTQRRYELFSRNSQLRASSRWWKRLGVVQSGDAQEVSLASFFYGRTEMPSRYGYLLRLRLSGKKESCVLTSLKVITWFQFAPDNLFRLLPGRNVVRVWGADSVRVASESEGEVRAQSRRLEIRIRYQEGCARKAPKRSG